ncbi:MAG: hypothetical protein ACREEP_04960, partial [Dongiaceae bacterium]
MKFRTSARTGCGEKPNIARLDPPKLAVQTLKNWRLFMSINVLLSYEYAKPFELTASIIPNFIFLTNQHLGDFRLSRGPRDHRTVTRFKRPNAPRDPTRHAGRHRYGVHLLAGVQQSRCLVREPSFLRLPERIIDTLEYG